MTQLIEDFEKLHDYCCKMIEAVELFVIQRKTAIRRPVKYFGVQQEAASRNPVGRSRSSPSLQQFPWLKLDDELHSRRRRQIFDALVDAGAVCPWPNAGLQSSHEFVCGSLSGLIIKAAGNHTDWRERNPSQVQQIQNVISATELTRSLAEERHLFRQWALRANRSPDQCEPTDTDKSDRVAKSCEDRGKGKRNTRFSAIEKHCLKEWKKASLKEGKHISLLAFIKRLKVKEKHQDRWNQKGTSAEYICDNIKRSSEWKEAQEYVKQEIQSRRDNRGTH